MDPNWRPRYGLRPTLRHLMILVVHFAVLFALIAPLLRGGLYGLVTFLLPLSPPLLAVLVLAFDRPSPAKYWFVGLLASLSFPGFVLWCDLIGVLAWRSGWWPVGVLLVLLVLNTFGVM